MDRRLGRIRKVKTADEQAFSEHPVLLGQTVRIKQIPDFGISDTPLYAYFIYTMEERL